MLGNFSYCNPTKLYFGDDALNFLNVELSRYGENIVLIYGGGSIRKNGIYDAVKKILADNGKNVAEISGVMPNPTVDKLYEGVRIAGIIGLISCWPWAAARYATTPRRFRYP